MKGKQRKIIGLITALCILFPTGNYIEYADYKAVAASEITTPANNINPQVSQAPADNITPMISQAPADNTSPQLTPAPTGSTISKVTQAPADNITPIVTQTPADNTTPQGTPVPAEDTETQDTAKTEQKKEYTGRILLNKKAISMEQGKSIRLSAKLSKKNQSGKNITYKSNNTKIITVTQKGFLKAVHYGTATVTATLGKAKAVCKVTVTKNITITISAAGDCTLSSDIKQYPAVNFFAVYNEHKNDAYFFKNVKPIFDKDDMTIVNFEGTLSNRGSRVDKKWAFRGKPSYINILKEGSIEAVAFANNHVVDYGKDSYLDTISSFKKAGITYSSYSTIGMYKVKGIKIGMISIQEVGRSDAADILREALKKMKAKNPDLLIVSFHWGIERTHSATKSQTDLSRMAINGGADLVLGHHPHVLQPVEKYKNSYIVYSLGNFCFGGNTNPPDKDTMIYQQTFTFHNDKLVPDNNVRIIPCSVSSVSYKNNYQPTPSKGKEKTRIRNKINGYSRQYGISFDKNGKVIVK